MSNKMLLKLFFVILTYNIYAILYYKLIRRWAKNDTDKYMTLWKAYVGTMLAFPTGLIVIYSLDAMFEQIFGGV